MINDGNKDDENSKSEMKINTRQESKQIPKLTKHFLVYGRKNAKKNYKHFSL